MEAPPDTGRPRLASKARLKWDEVRQKPMLLFPEGVLVLNPAAYEVLQLCDGRTVAEIVVALKAKFGGETIDADVKNLVARLVDKGLMMVTMD